ncbi:hypothetical protein F3D3_3692 [Fusibacter sp. 3D3]|nr:hypothetical protein F3D3_3692 [Fusibacter sp. 3D3]
MIDVIFKEVFSKSGFVVREEQESLSKHIYRNMLEHKILLSDIPVGLGKTHAYLVAAIVFNFFLKKNALHNRMPIVFTTSSIELQRAITQEDIPEISAQLLASGILKAPITYVLRKDKENYVRENRLRDYVNTLDPSKKRITEYTALKRLLSNGVIDLGEVNAISYL